MKKILLIALLLVPFLGISQTTKPIEGFLGIKFGASRADVIAAVKAKGGVLTDHSTETYLIFSNVKLGPRASVQFDVKLFNDKCYQGYFYFKPDKEPEIIDYYNSLVNDISEIYGKGEPFKQFKSPYENGDGHEVGALEGGYAKFFTNWNSGSNFLQANIVIIKDDLYVILNYLDLPTEAASQAAEKAKTKSDY